MDEAVNSLIEQAFTGGASAGILLPTDEGWTTIDNAPPDHPFLAGLNKLAKKEQSGKDCEVANAAVKLSRR